MKVKHQRLRSTPVVTPAARHVQYLLRCFDRPAHFYSLSWSEIRYFRYTLSLVRTHESCIGDIKLLCSYVDVPKSSSFASIKSRNLIAFTIEQEAHGPHRSPEKTVQINKHI